MTNKQSEIDKTTNDYEYMLSTSDNPYDYFENFKEWYQFDIEKGYNSCSYLARIADIPENCSSAEENAEIERAIDEIIKYDFTNNRIKIRRKIKKPSDEEQNQHETTNETE